MQNSPWVISLARWLTLRRIRAHAAILAICLWGVCAVDYSTGGNFDRAGNIKFQDFLPIYISAQLVSQHRTSDVYEPNVIESEMRAIVGDTGRVRLTYVYGPQVALLFAPLASLSFLTAAGIWVALSVLIYFACVGLVWRSCSNLRPHLGLAMLSALAFPPLYHCFVRGQLAALWLACFTAAFLALRAGKLWLAGAFFGLLAMKPTFLVAIPIILLLARAWKILISLTIVAAAQIAFTRWYFGSATMNAYLNLFRQPSSWVGTAELTYAPTIMHSLRAFWTLLVPSSAIALALYLLSSIAVVAVTAAIWRSDSPLALRFSALTLAAVLVNPHLFIYDLLVLAPALLLLVDWALANERDAASASIRVLSYITFLLLLFGPLSRWTHLQLSVVAFTLMLWAIFRRASPSHKLALDESGVV